MIRKMSIPEWLYETVPGRMCLKILTRPALSKLAGLFLNTGASRFLIPSFARSAGIRMEDYEPSDIGAYHDFNSFFVRRIRPELRSVDMEPAHLISPCDGLLSAYPVEKGRVIPVKQSSYTVASLLRSRKEAERFEGGWCLVFRLCTDNYHRYAYVDGGVKGRNIFLPGVLHTVRPVALRSRPVFIENCREYTEIETENFGRIIQMEVGAMLVGKIENDDEEAIVSRGEEKGRFLFGGSTIIVLLEKGRASLPERLLENTRKGVETRVKLGQRIGTKK